MIKDFFSFLFPASSQFLHSLNKMISLDALNQELQNFLQQSEFDETIQYH